MSAATLTPAGPAPAPASPYRLGFGRVLKSEWIKFRTLRSTVWTLAITIAVMAGLSLMLAAVMKSLLGDASVAESDLMPGWLIVVFGYSFAQLAIAVLGALTITGEHSTGMIRSTFSAVPARVPAFLAKTLVVAVVTLVVTVVGVGVAYLVSLPFLSGTPLEVDFSADGSLTSLLGTPMYLTLIGVISIAMGALIRNSAGSIFALVALFLVLPGILTGVPVDWMNTLGMYLPSAAGEQLIMGGAFEGAVDTLGPWEGFAVMGAWAVVLWLAAAVVLKRRDA